ncbi:MAG TPA: TfoX/Sxy family protein [Segeticoccus sp.]|nr:TfoX/Sxy family protein [Segeticoccus sp.]
MAYDEELADRIRETLQDETELTERRMFGGLAFLVRGNMAVAASGQGGLLVHIDPTRAVEWVDGRHVRRMEMRGRAMDGWLRVDSDVLDSDRALQQWVARGVARARSLPPK